MGTIKICKHFE